MAGQGSSNQFQIGGAKAWSLLDLCPSLPALYHSAQYRHDIEFAASSFAETLLNRIVACINSTLGADAVQIDFVSQQPPEGASRRRIDFQIKAWCMDSGRAVPYVLAHVEVKRHSAPPSDVEGLESQIITACEATQQPLVYAIAFHGTAIRIWSWRHKVLHALTGLDSHDTDSKDNWADASERGAKACEVLGAVESMFQYPPRPLCPKL